MAQQYGFRTSVVLENVTSGQFGPTVPLFLEVTASVNTKIFINDNPDSGYLAPGIPLTANVMRTIPMQAARFRADAPVTVVGYLP